MDNIGRYNERGCLKKVFCISICQGGKKEKIGGEMGITPMPRHPGKQRNVSSLVCLPENKISLVLWEMKQEVERPKEWMEIF